MKNALLPRILALAERATATNDAMYKSSSDQPIDWNKRQQDENEMYAEMEAINKAAGPGLAVGRKLSFGVADGSANYIITKVLKNVVYVEWIPLCDGYSSPAVGLSSDKRNYVVLRSTAETYCNC